MNSSPGASPFTTTGGQAFTSTSGATAPNWLTESATTGAGPSPAATNFVAEHVANFAAEQAWEKVFLFLFQINNIKHVKAKTNMILVRRNYCC